MKQAFSLGAISQEKRSQAIAVIPPGSEKFARQGELAIEIGIQYLQNWRDKLHLRTKLWGREQEILTFEKGTKAWKIVFSIHSGLSQLTRYFEDMGVITIQCIGDVSPIGWIFVSIRRFIVNFQLSDFEEIFPVVDKRKVKVGEATVKFNMVFHPQTLYPNATHHQLQRANSQVGRIQNKVSFAENIIPAHREGPASSQAGTFQIRNTIEQQSQRRNKSKDQLKEGAHSFLRRYFDGKPEHSELSMIRGKYGFNDPAVQAMRLDLDAATLLSPQMKPENQAIPQSILLLLKIFTCESKSKADTIIVSSQQLQGKVTSQTRIDLTLINNKAEVNHTFNLPNLSEQDIIVFQSKEGRAQINFGLLKKANRVDLKSKNGRKIGQIQFQITFQAFPQSRQMKSQIKEKSKQKYLPPISEKKKLEIPLQIPKRPLSKQKQIQTNPIKFIAEPLTRLPPNKDIQPSKNIEGQLQSQSQKAEYLDHAIGTQRSQAQKMHTEPIQLPSEDQVQDHSIIPSNRLQTQPAFPRKQLERQVTSYKGTARQDYRQNQNPKQENSQLSDDKPIITIILSGITIKGIQKVNFLQIISESKAIVELFDQQVSFPKAVQLKDNQLYTIICKTQASIIQGVFIAYNKNQKVKLYTNGEQVGQLRLFYLEQNNKVQTQEQQIAVQVTEIANLPQLTIPAKPQAEEIIDHAQCGLSRARSPMVKLTIRSIRPSRPNYRLQVQSSTQVKSLNYPNKNELILDNCQSWTVSLPDLEVDSVKIGNFLSSNPYYFASTHDAKAIFSAMIQVEQCWQQALEQGFHQEGCHLIFHLDKLISCVPLKEGKYSLVLETHQKMTSSHFIIDSSCAKDQYIGQSFHISSLVQKASIKLIKNDKQQICEFLIALKLPKQRINKSCRYLQAKSGLRLKLTLYQINCKWDLCKPHRIIGIFSSQNRKTIQSWLKSINNPSQQQLVSWMRNNLKLTLTQINILLEQLLQGDENADKFCNLFKNQQNLYFNDMESVREEFSVFDFTDEGVVSQEQLKMAKKVFSKSFQQFHKSLLSYEYKFTLIPQMKDNYIIDLSQTIAQNSFDYISFLSLFSFQNIQQFSKIDKEIKRNQKYKAGEWLQVKLIEFNDLAIDGLPCTLLFKIGNKSLADPIHKCYSFIFSNPRDIIVASKPRPRVSIYLKRLRSNGQWQFTLLETVDLNERVKALGGNIIFQINYTNKQPSYEPLVRPQLIANQNRRENRQSPPRANKYKPSENTPAQFSKSFWNKSLQQTRQKWNQQRQKRQQQQKYRQKDFVDKNFQQDDD